MTFTAGRILVVAVLPLRADRVVLGKTVRLPRGIIRVDGHGPAFDLAFDPGIRVRSPALHFAVRAVPESRTACQAEQTTQDNP